MGCDHESNRMEQRMVDDAGGVYGGCLPANSPPDPGSVEDGAQFIIQQVDGLVYKKRLVI